MARPKGSAEVIEARRRQALRLLDQDYSLGEVGRMLGCAPSSVMRWRDARTRGGKQALKVRPTPGRPAQLKARDRLRIVACLMKGALANGFATELWTISRVATVIHRCCGIEYHRSHVARLLHEMGFSCQKFQFLRPIGTGRRARSRWFVSSGTSGSSRNTDSDARRSRT